MSVFVASADLMEEGGELYPPLLIPGSAVAQVHQVFHLLHRLDGGHLQNHSQNDMTAYVRSHESDSMLLLVGRLFL